MNGLLTLASNTLDAVCVLEQRIATILTPTPPAPTAATEKNNPARSAMVINLAEISNILRLAAEELNNITQRVEL